MRKLLLVLGAVFGVLLIVICAGVAFVAVKGNALDKESHAYVDNALPAIMLHWSQDELTQRASPEFLRAINSDDLAKLLSAFHRKLGDLAQYKGSKGDALMALTTQNGKVITANYVATADFQQGPATIQIKLIKHDDNWQILGFHVESKVLLEQ